MSDLLRLQKAQHIAKCLQLAMMLEVSVQKPGNVSFTASFEKTRVEHFLASAVAAGPSLQEAASRGAMVAEGQLNLERLGIGELIKTCSEDVTMWQRGGNTILGTVMLFVPLATAAGMTPTKQRFCFDFSVLRRNLDLVVRASSAWDAVHLYEAIDIACPSGLGGAPDLDVTQTDSKKRLIEENVGLFEVFKLAAAYDDICYEWVNNYPITFDLAYPYLTEQLRNKPLNTAVVHTFLKILAERPDTFVARKMGKPKAQEISKDAQTSLEIGGLETPEGRESLAEFDKKLRNSGNTCNPGTTADLTATTLALCVLNGYRP
ncbi:triphosphoribosyl-dephospho-CoA synthase [Candidatus Bathycorpusculum sp.]|uniref:triphosphoribosyl-dephospho-CoA synthase n=1 Tax=Candidatus Bathycorpusculum sp. TaxID=2994959 RepID=UPI00281EF9C6|nr:triphosphoribosyl-dephospho-CoA synthase [Candidatus Termitimicrobium sp.]MCL2685425.1 triphosphoribosyl-dephospho-CoA synthase [Candidatus Termitimicrobium sp.]